MATTTRRTVTRLGLAAPALALLPRGLRAADAPVRIGAPYPLTGGAASAGTAVKQAIEVAVDIINNAHPELPDLPLAATAGLPGLGGSQGRGGLRRPSGQPRHRAERGAAADHPGQGGGAGRLLPVKLRADRQRGGRALWRPVHGERGVRAQPDRTRLQVALPADADRHGFRRGLCVVHRRQQGQGRQGRQDRHGQREHRVRHLDRQRDPRGGDGKRASRSTRVSPTTPIPAMSARRCCN